MKKLFVLILLLATKIHAQVPTAELIKDINAGHFSGKVGFLTKLNDNKVLFFAEDEYYGRELWSTDGTTQGTYMLKDIAPGRTGSVQDPFFDNVFHKPVVLNEVMYFFADDGVNEEQLWRTDGTSAGTFSLTQKFPAAKKPFKSTFTWLFSFGNSVYFWRGTANSYWNLYKTQGSVVSTVLVKQLEFGNRPSAFVVFKNSLHFVGNGRNESIASLWKTDGTSAGTMRTGPVFPTAFKYATVVNNELYCFVSNQEGLWKTDGSVGGTKQIRAMNGYSYSTKVSESNNLAYFWSGERVPIGSRLWRSNGELTGTMAISTERHTNSFLVFKNRCFFAHQRKTETGYELWTTDGTPETTRPFSLSFTGYSPSYFTESNGFMYYYGGLRSSDSRFSNSIGIWQTDGTSGGTHVIGQLGKQTKLPAKADFYRGDGENFDGFEEEAFVVLGNSILFIAEDVGSSTNESTGTELYRIPVRKISLGTTSNNKSIQTRTANQLEDFNVFIQKFSKNPTFQRSRVKFPLIWEEHPDDKTVIHRELQATWKHIDILKPSSKDYEVTVNFPTADKPNEASVGESCRGGCGYGAGLTFKRIDNVWYCVSRYFFSN